MWTKRIVRLVAWFHSRILVKAGGTKKASARLKIQLPAADTPTPLALYVNGKTSDA